MRRRGLRAGLLLAASAIACASAAGASETIVYSYDALGRLVATTSSGSVNNNVATTIAYDPAGNRSSYAVTSGSPPPPPPANNGPTAIDDSGVQPKCTTGTYSVLQNDSDVDGDYPLALVSVTGTGFSVLSATLVQFVSLASTGAKSGLYTVRDSRGTTATATLTVTVSGGTCPLSAPAAPPPPAPPPPDEEAGL